jgi:hypothetical protein
MAIGCGIPENADHRIRPSPRLAARGWAAPEPSPWELDKADRAWLGVIYCGNQKIEVGSNRCPMDVANDDHGQCPHGEVLLKPQIFVASDEDGETLGFRRSHQYTVRECLPAKVGSVGGISELSRQRGRDVMVEQYSCHA